MGLDELTWWSGLHLLNWEVFSALKIALNLSDLDDFVVLWLLGLVVALTVLIITLDLRLNLHVDRFLKALML